MVGGAMHGGGGMHSRGVCGGWGACVVGGMHGRVAYVAGGPPW